MKAKSYFKVVKMIERLTVEREKTVKEYTAAHPRAVVIAGMMAALVWVADEKQDNIEKYLEEL